MNKNILFVTGTRADLGKIKSLMIALSKSDRFCVTAFVTGMHMLSKYGSTHFEVDKIGIRSFKYINMREGDPMDVVLSNSISGMGAYVNENDVDLIVVHGDRVEACAGSVVGVLNNIPVAHIEGGEVSGTVDEMLRHSISKLSQYHFVANHQARDRLIQMGEASDSVFVIGSPDLDIMGAESLPSLDQVKEKYQIDYKDYGIILYHPVTTSLTEIKSECEGMMKLAKELRLGWIVINPNNDHGSEIIDEVYENCDGDDLFRFIPSMRFEYFLTLLKNARLLMGNSSAGIRETPFYGVPSVNIGSRQNGRGESVSVLQAPNIKALDKCLVTEHMQQAFEKSCEFGDGKSTERFLDALNDPKFWVQNVQKKFNDLNF